MKTLIRRPWGTRESEQYETLFSIFDESYESLMGIYKKLAEYRRKF